MREVGFAEVGEEGVQVVGGGGEVEKWRGGFDEGLDVGVELWHTWDWSRWVDEGAFENAEGARGEGYFDCVVDICQSQLAI